MATGNRRRAMSEINVTPLVDVMLVLLVVFMVTVPVIVKCRDQGKVDVDLPKTDASKPLTEEIQTMLIVTKDGEVKLDRGGEAPEEATEDEENAAAAERSMSLVSCAGVKDDFAACLEPLQAKLETISYLKDGRKIYFVADRTLPYGLVVDVMARIKAAGIANIGMVTQPTAVE